MSGKEGDNDPVDVSTTKEVEVEMRDDSYVPPPLYTARQVLTVGMVVYGIAWLWPPLILLVTLFLAKWVPYWYRQNDDAVRRRILLHEFEQTDRASDFLREFPRDDVDVIQGYWKNDRGMILATTVLKPKSHIPIRGVVCHCHGYLDYPTYTKLKTFCQLVQQSGIAMVLIDYEGHGRSDGDLGLIKDFDPLIHDVSTFFQETCTREFPNKKVFLWGESMGGAIAFETYQRTPKFYGGVIFQSPMCKVADHMLPPDWVIALCQWIAGPTGTVSRIGYLPLAPARGDLKFLAHKLAAKRRLFTRVPCVFGRTARLATGRELINMTKRVSANMSNFDAPCLILHGTADKVTDYHLSQALYDEASTTDKTLRLYDGMWHTLLNGEPDENIARILKDVQDWILERCPHDKKN